MYPSLKPGDVLVLAAAEARSIKRGDIIGISRGRRYIVHRVVDIRSGTPTAAFVTKGDNLPTTDAPLSADGGPFFRVTLIERKGGRLVRPRFGNAFAFLSRNNLTPGIIKGRIGAVVRKVNACFQALLGKDPKPI